MQAKYPIEHDNTILEKVSERYFRSVLPVEWIVDKPSDYGIDLNITLVVKNEVIGFNFSIQLKAKNDCNGKLEVSLKKTTLNYLFNRLEPVMVVLYDEKTKQAYWKWLIKQDFDLSQEKKTYLIKFDNSQCVQDINWEDIQGYVQKVFKIQQNLLTSLEYDLFNSDSDLEVKAWGHYLRKNYPEAIFHFRRLLDEKCEPVWLLALAQCEYENFEYDRALHSINLALELDHSENILLTKACILSEAGHKANDIYKVKAAEKIFAELYEKAPTAVNCYNYANTSHNLKEDERAERLFKEVLALDRNHAEAWRNLGQLHFDKKKYKDALNCYETALRIKPQLVQAIASKGIVLGVGYKRYKLALELLEESARLKKTIFTEFPDIFYWLSHFNSLLGNVDLALVWVNRGLEHRPGDTYLRGQKAQIFVHLMPEYPHILDQAIDFFKDNEQFNPNDSINHYYWAEALMLKGDSDLARQKLTDWYHRYLPFERNIVEEKIAQYDIPRLAPPLLHWEVLDRYLTHYNILKVSAALAEIGLICTDDFLIEFQINRILFMDAFFKDAVDVKKRTTLLQCKTTLVEEMLGNFTGKSLGKMISADKMKALQVFAEQFSEVIANLSALMIQELAQCIGIVIGTIFPNQNEVIDELMDESNYGLVLIKFTELLYVEFKLPMGD